MKRKVTKYQLVVVIVATLFILFGFAQAIFKFTVNKTFLDIASFVLVTIAALMFYLGKRNLARKEVAATQDEKTEKDIS